MVWWIPAQLGTAVCGVCCCRLLCLVLPVSGGQTQAGWRRDHTQETHSHSLPHLVSQLLPYVLGSQQPLHYYWKGKATEVSRSHLHKVRDYCYNYKRLFKRTHRAINILKWITHTYSIKFEVTQSNLNV